MATVFLVVFLWTTILIGDVTKDPFHNLQVGEQTGILKHYAINTDFFL